MPLPRQTRERILTPADRIAAEKHGCRYDPAAGEHCCAFFERFLRHSKGRLAGKPFELLPWERSRLLEPLFGWKRPDGTRRFRKGYGEIAKKNGKSTICAGIGLYLLIADGELGAEVYCAAYDRRQAGIVFREASLMVKQSPDLKRRVRVIPTTSRIVYHATGSFLATLSKDSGSAEGLNIHGLIFDELHTQKSRSLWDALEYGGVAREQPLQIAITTAGWDRESICYEVRQYARQVRDGEVDDPSFFTLICSAAETDEEAGTLDVMDPAAWERANPSLGVTMNVAEFEQSAKTAVSVPRSLNKFKRYRLNVWTEGDERWISDELWTPCADPARGEVADPAAWREAKMSELEGRECFAGLDLGQADDLTSLVLCFRDEVPFDAELELAPHVEPDGEAAKVDEARLAELRRQEAEVRSRLRAYTVTLIPFVWLPRDTPAHRKPQVRAMYEDWAARGFVVLTPGNVMDHNRIRADIRALGHRYRIREIGVDRDRTAVQICTDLHDADGFEVIAVGQGFRTMGAACWEWEDRVVSRRLTHGNSPVLSWAMRNTVVKEDPAGNLKPVKPSRRSHLKIDPVVAGLMALLRASETGETRSVYEERGLIGV